MATTPWPNTSALDPGIVAAVTFMRGHGFETTDSGDGVSKGGVGAGEADVLAFPHVFAVVSPAAMVAEADRLAALPWESAFRARPRVEASYSPDDGVAVLMATWGDQ